jgi:nitrate reductase gamma subunit
VVSFADPDAPSPVNWTLGLAAVVALAAGVVVLIARRTRNPPLRQG